MTNQFNNQRCSNCNSKYSGWENVIGRSAYCGHEHFFKKNRQLFCAKCLMEKGHMNCSKCHKLIRSYDELGGWRKNVVLLGDHTADLDFSAGAFVCECRECSTKIRAENKPNQQNYNGWGPGNPEWEKQKNCRIGGCPYKVSPSFEKLGTCSVHVKKCQGTIFTQYGGEIQCDLAVPTDGGNFCKGCENQSETYQQRKVKSENEGKKIFKKYKEIQKKAQNWWSALSSSEREEECERVVENLKLGKYRGGKLWEGNKDMEGYGSGWACDGSFWQIENGKYVSSKPHLVPCEITEEFVKKEIGFNDRKAIEWISSQEVVTNNNNDNRKRKRIEIISSEEENNNSNGNNRETLVINSKKIKQINLRKEGSLGIVFNDSSNSQNSNQPTSQVVSAEQINNNPKLQAVKNYLRKTGKKSLNKQELEALLDSNLTLNETPKDTSKFLWIGATALVFGLLVCLLATSKRNSKKR